MLSNIFNFKVKNKKLFLFLILSFLFLVFINFQFITAYILFIKYGSLTLYPGERYTLNIPFVGTSKNPVVCGFAKRTDGSFVDNVSVIAKLEKNSTIIAENTTKKDGFFCLSLPLTNKTTKYDIYLEFDNSTLSLGDNDYELNFDNYKVYNKSAEDFFVLSGNFINKDAEVQDGRVEIKMGYKNGTWKYIFGDYKRYSVNIAPNEVYYFPNEELNFSQPLSQLQEGEYKLLVKTSFNGKEYVGCAKCSVYFNVTS